MKALVRKILEKFWRARGSDEFLIAKVVDMTYSSFLTKAERDLLTERVIALKIPSILRCRRMLQEDNHHLRDDNYNDRQAHCNTVKKQILNRRFEA